MSEVLTLALVAQWPRWRSARDFWRFAQAHLRAYFPALGSQSQVKWRVRAAEPTLRALHAALATQLGTPQAASHVVDTHLLADSTPTTVRWRRTWKRRRLGGR